MNEIYLDHAATSPMHPQVIQVMTEVMSEVFGNPSSIHQLGRHARKYLDDARHVIATSIQAKDNEIIFTGGGSEADNLAIRGTAYAKKAQGRHIITTAIEHHAVLHPCEQLETEGFEVTYLPVNEQGVVSVADVEQALREDTILVTIMAGNNEVGSIQPIAEIGALLTEHQATFHTDAVQAFGLEKINVDELKVDLLSASAHKLNGPKGVGFLYQREHTPLQPLILGGEQERKRRAGTENIPGIVGFAKAVEIAQATMDEKRTQLKKYQQIIVDTFTAGGIHFKVNGQVEKGLPHVLNISFAGMDVESFLVNLDMAGVAVSSGSACTAGSIDPSHVLVAMFGKDSAELRNSIRFSFGYGLTDDTVAEAAKRTVDIVQRLANV